MTVESVIFLAISILATLKAYFEWKKAKAEVMRADKIENMLKHTIKSVETAKSNMDTKTQIEFAVGMRQYIETSPCDTDTVHRVVKEVTEGEGDIKAIL